MFSRSAHLYDLIYGAFKDYEAESAWIAGMLREWRPEGRRLLDVACGTGEHARHLNERGFEVDGLDIEPSFLEIARDKNPRGRFIAGDMADFDIDERYDAVLCLFSSIGYVKSGERLLSALRAFARHIIPEGLVVVEPWFAPGEMTAGAVYMVTAERDDLKVCRMSHTRLSDRLSHLHFEYLVGSADGVERFEEEHEMGLFSRAEMAAAFRAAGLRAHYEPEGPSGRGLWLGWRA